ncbi:hypothetical protein [uncultured Dubosiella sp.]|uniref:hypothetical protein n=1 Tax=uncultured Dubosiella sp. TaxID=1937011 RepID=UPI0025B473D3|nr:hypothetical protein [uncultured Dubosiella sp.]
MATKNGALTAKELTHCAMLGALFYIVFHMFANLLYVEAITFSIFVCAQVFSRKEVVMACALTGLLQLLFHGFMPWNVAYALIFPGYALWFATLKRAVKKHEWIAWINGAIAALFLGQLVDLPFILFDKKLTILYILMGLKTSIIQAGIVFLEFVFLYDPFVRALKKIVRAGNR